MNKTKKLVLIGHGEFGRIAFEYFSVDSEYEVVAFSAEARFVDSETYLGVPVVAFELLEHTFPPNEVDVFVAITSTKLNTVRRRMFELAKAKGYTCASYTSSHAFVWRNVALGENCFVFEGNVLQPFVKVGDNVILWSGNHIGHSSTIDSHCFLASHVVISGHCHIGAGTFLGVNATISNNLRVGKDNLIGASALIASDTEDGQIYRGVPSEPSKVSSYRFHHLRRPHD